MSIVFDHVEGSVVPDSNRDGPQATGMKKSPTASTPLKPEELSRQFRIIAQRKARLHAD